MSGTSAEKERSQITGRAGVVAIGTLASRVLGLGRDIALAAVFSRSATDAWLVAWQIPNLLRQILAEGAVQTAVLPVLSEVKEQEGDEAARQYFRNISGVFVCALLLTSALGMVFSEQITAAFASGFRSRAGQLELTASLTRWVFPYIFFMGSAALGLAALNTHRRFVVTSFAPGLLNVAFLVCSFGLPGWLAYRGVDPIYAMVVGGLSGGALQVVAQWPSLRKIGYLNFPSFQLTHPAIKKTLKRLAPTLIGVGVYGIDVMVGRRMLSDLAEGSVTYFTYALRLCDFSQGIFVMALSSATLPSLATFVARGELGEVASTFAFSLRLALFVGLAATAGSLCLAEPLVQTIFEHGQFNAHDTSETTLAFLAQGAGIFLVAGVRQLVIVFFALGKTMVPVYVAIVDVVVFAAVGLGLRDSIGHVGISWAVTAARVAQFGLLWFFLRRYLPTMHEKDVLWSVLRNLTAAALGGIATFFAVGALLTHLSLPFSGTGLGLFRLILGAGVFSAVFFPCAHALKSEELATVAVPIKRRLLRVLGR